MSRLTQRMAATLLTASHTTLLASGCAHSTPPALAAARAKQPSLVPMGGNVARTLSSASNVGVDDGTYSEGTLDDDQDDQDDDSGTVEGGVERTTRPHPLAAYSDDELADLFTKHPAFVGSVSIGKPNAGRLMNGVRPKESTLHHLVDPGHAWGTTETVEALDHVLDVVAQSHPGTQTIDIGHISAHDGGPLRPHHSHQSGRDVDLGFYYVEAGTRWYTRATGQSLDAPRTWTLIRTLAKDTDIEMILLDRRLQDDIETYAFSVERDANWVRSLFHGDAKRPALVRHCPGHATHMHLRFYNPLARETARRLGPFLPKDRRRETREAPTTIVHVASSGDTLAKLAQRFHTTMEAIRKANHMRTFQLVAGQRYVIPLEAPAPNPPSQSRMPGTAHTR